MKICMGCGRWISEDSTMCHVCFSTVFKDIPKSEEKINEIKK